MAASSIPMTYQLETHSVSKAAVVVLGRLLFAAIFLMAGMHRPKRNRLVADSFFLAPPLVPSSTGFAGVEHCLDIANRAVDRFIPVPAECTTSVPC